MILRLPLFSSASRSMPQLDALRVNCSRLSSNEISRQRSPAATPAATNSEPIRVLPEPVGPDTMTTESRKKPPEHMRSSEPLPVVTLSLDAGGLSAIRDIGRTTTPSCCTIVKSHSPERCSAPLNFRTSNVRRRFSRSGTLRRMTTLSATNSSTPNLEIGPCSSERSTVRTEVTPISLSAEATRNSSKRTDV